jgi:hypothetical protein
VVERKEAGGCPIGRNDPFFHLFWRYSLHRPCKGKFREGNGVSVVLQWKYMGALFTEKKQETVNSVKNKPEKEQCMSQLHKESTKSELCLN